MKTLKNISLYRFVIFGLFIGLLLGCRDEREKLDPLSQMQKQLRGTWTISEVTLSEADVSIFYDGLTVTFNNDKSFVCTNEVDPVWPATGSYENILENELKFILREDGIRMQVISLTSNTLNLQFSWAGIPGGKLKSMNGEYQFTFTK